MQTPVEIDFQGMRGRPEVQASIQHHVAELEQRYGRVTACRVVLKGPGGHHRTGGLYEVNIRLALPNGREVYFHSNSVLDGAFSRLAVGTHVIFAEEMGEKGPQASTVKLLGKHRLRL